MATQSAYDIAIVSAHRYRAESLALALSREPFLRPRIMLPPDVARLAGFPTVLIEVDDNMKSALQLARAIVQQCPRTKVILLGVHESDRNVVQVAESGASGYASPSNSVQEVAAIIRAVQKGEFICSPPAAYTLFKRLAELAKTKAPRAPGGTVLTARERHIVELMSQNLSNKEIAGQLFLSTYTVKNHVHRILKKLQLPNRRNIFRYLCPESSEGSQVDFR